MRIISGSKKGKSLLAIPGESTRPTSDKVKESVFNIIGPYFEGGLVLDLYAGTGSLGIEALSRGMDHAVFVDTDKKAVNTIKKNLTVTDLIDYSEVYKSDANQALKVLLKKQILFDLVFLDPPYIHHQIEKKIAYLNQSGLLKTDAVLVVETSASPNFPEQIGSVFKKKEVRYGNTCITIFQKSE